MESDISTTNVKCLLFLSARYLPHTPSPALYISRLLTDRYIAFRSFFVAGLETQFCFVVELGTQFSRSRR